MSGKSVLWPSTAVLVWFAVSAVLLVVVNRIVIRPYMDEVFHIPQAQEYCSGNYGHWDPKITTPPGLYLLSVGLLNPLSQNFPQIFECSLNYLRSINLLFALGNIYIFYLLFKKLHSHQPDARLSDCAFNALTIGLFPPLYFFTFLYYTDAGSTFSILLAYLLALHKYHLVAAGIGAVAILFRQTNIIWVAFFALLALSDILEKYGGKELRKVPKSDWRYLRVSLQSSVGLISNREKLGCYCLMSDVLSSCGGYLVVGVGFAAFVLKNNGIVLGDRTAHRATVHLPQLFYFCVFALCFLFPHFISWSTFGRSLQSIRRHPLITILLTLGMFATIYLNTLVHPYLLADNRHYPFYVWRRFLDRGPISRYCFIPMYLFAGNVIVQDLRQQRGALWILLFALCVAANIVPQELLEFRYFILPYLIVRLNLSVSRSKYALTAEFLLYTAVNAYTLYTFLMRPFVWPNALTLQRFMW